MKWRTEGSWINFVKRILKLFLDTIESIQLSVLENHFDGKCETLRPLTSEFAIILPLIKRLGQFNLSETESLLMCNEKCGLDDLYCPPCVKVLQFYKRVWSISQWQSTLPCACLIVCSSCVHVQTLCSTFPQSEKAGIIECVVWKVDTSKISTNKWSLDFSNSSYEYIFSFIPFLFYERLKLGKIVTEYKK